MALLGNMGLTQMFLSETFFQASLLASVKSHSQGYFALNINLKDLEG